MAQTNKWTVKDVITTVLLSVLMVVIQLIINALMMFNNFVSMVFGSAVSGLICGIVYVLLVTRVKKHFPTLVYNLILAVVYFIMAYWFVAVFLLFVGILSEVIMWKYPAKPGPARPILSWAVQCLLSMGIAMLPIWFVWADYVEASVAGGMSMDYINAYQMYYTQTGWVLLIAVINIVLGFLGAFLGTKMLGKHFKKAGLL